MNDTAPAPRINGLTMPAPDPPSPSVPEPSLLDRVIEATRPGPAYTLAEVQTMATAAARSQMYGLSESQAFTLMMLAEAEGLHPVKALQRYHVIDDKPSMRADAMQAEYQRRGGRLRWVETTDEGCRLEAWHPALHPEHLVFEVRLKDLVDRGVALQWDRDARKYVLKGVYRRFPRQMLRARAISEMVRAIAPAVVVGMYTPEEVGDFARGADLPPIPPPAPPRPRPRPAPPPPDPDPEPEPDPDPEPDDRAGPGPEAASPLRRYVRAIIATAEDEFRRALAGAGEDVPEKLEVCNEHQVINGLVRDWLDAGSLDEADILDQGGRRDRRKIARVVTEAYANNRDVVRADVLDYVHRKADRAYRTRGLTPPRDRDRDRDEAHATADDEPGPAPEAVT